MDKLTSDCKKQRKLHTPVPEKGSDGDSSGYLSFAPEVNEPLTWRQRYPYRGLLSLIDRDGVKADGVEVRMAPTGAQLQQEAFTPFSGMRQLDTRMTVEFRITASEPGATVLFQFVKTVSA